MLIHATVNDQYGPTIIPSQKCNCNI